MYYAEDVLYRTDLHCIMLKGVLYRTDLHKIMLMCTVLCLELKSLLSIPRGRRSLCILSLLLLGVAGFLLVKYECRRIGNKLEVSCAKGW